MAVVLSQLLRHSDNHGNSLKKRFLRKMTFQSVTHTGRPIGVEATTFRLLVRMLYHYLSLQGTSGSQGKVQVTNYPGTYC